MPGKNLDLNENILRENEFAQKKYRSFEFAFHVLQKDDLFYLREQSVAYRKAVQAIQKLIMPKVGTVCPRCPHGTCCRLYSPELNIYIAGSVGGFGLTDYLLVRCAGELPEPNFANSRLNLCAFWDNGCRLKPDSRSLLCLQYFCEPLRRVLEMEIVNRRVAELKVVVKNFSMSRLFRK
jgi:hypothetical protein